MNKRAKNRKGIEAFGSHLRQLREQRNLSQQAIADIADISKLTVQRIELAKVAVTVDVLISLAHGLQIPMRELMNFELPTEER
ncbi:helix-turn-helix domain-containing protein [Hymenobacter fodinae]|uniref:XRE family transcriptional regulator n=1 Tax=Hymenobacter fodinae TaxID=2510796 RepID=A0A4Z0P4E7_9BACT|nr:XRE family transcriptional regulator [Hymenobacter fodinae]